MPKSNIKVTQCIIIIIHFNIQTLINSVQWAYCYDNAVMEVFRNITIWMWTLSKSGHKLARAKLSPNLVSWKAGPLHWKAILGRELFTANHTFGLVWHGIILEKTLIKISLKPHFLAPCQLNYIGRSRRVPILNHLSIIW